MTLLLSFSSLVSRLLGLFRSNRLADVFGATGMSDAYFAAFQIPDLLYSLIVFGAISAAFVPLFTRIRKQRGKEMWAFASSVLNLFLVLTGVLSLIVFLFAQPIVNALYSGMESEQRSLVVDLLRIMLLSPLFFAASSILSGIQTSYRHFWGYAMAPIVYNLSIILGIVYLSDLYGIHGVAYGVVLGAFLHSLVQVIPCIWLGFRWKPILLLDRNMKQLFVMGLPRILSLGSYQINLMVEAVIATGVTVGGLTVLRYAQDIQSFPLGIVGLSVAIASFSVFSEMVVDGDHTRLAMYFRYKVDQILLFILPATAGLFLFRSQMVHLVLSTGAFDPSAVRWTEMTLASACLGLVAMSLLPLISRMFYSFHDTWRPFVTGLIMLILNAMLAYFMAHRLGIYGLALSYSILVSLQVPVLFILLKRKHLPNVALVHWKHVFFFALATGFMSSVLWVAVDTFSWDARWLPYLLQLAVMSMFGAFCYFLCVRLLFGKKLYRFIGGANSGAGEVL